MTEYTQAALTAFAVDRQYPNPGAWHGEVYARRTVVESPSRDTTLAYTKRTEQCPALNDDAATIGTFNYYQGGHLVLKALACNYEVALSVTNPQEAAQTFTVVINDLPQATFTLAGGDSATYELSVALCDRSFDLTFENPEDPVKGGVLTVVNLKLTAKKTPAHAQPWLWIASDSTVQTYTDHEDPQTGWGAVLAEALMPDGQAVATIDQSAPYTLAHHYENGALTIVNRAIGGRSARSFIEEGKLENLARDLAAGDLLLIQWGDNDATSYRPMRYVAPADFAAWLQMYLATAIDRGARPVLVTPPSQCQFDEDLGRVGFAPYRQVMLDLAASANVPCIDLGKASADLMTAFGPTNAQAMFLQFAPKNYPGFVDGIHDKTHFNRFGARTLAQVVAAKVAALPDVPFTWQTPAEVNLAAPQHLGAEVALDGAIRLRWWPVAGAGAYRIHRQNAAGDIADFTALDPTFLDAEPNGDATYRVCALNTQGAVGPLAEITVHAGDTTAVAPHIAGLNVYEVDHQTLPDAVAFSLRFTAHPHVATYVVELFNQRTRETRRLGTIASDAVYALHSYQAPKAGVWIVQVSGQDTTTNERLLSQSVQIR